jgi:hypothetical protein
LNRCETAARSAAVLRKRAVTDTLLQVLRPQRSEMSEKKALPAKLEEDLASAKFYKPSSAGQETTAEKMAKVFDDSKERAMYDEILGPMLGNRGSKPVTAPKPSVTAGSDFNTSIITRLKQVEMEAKDMRMRLAEQIAINEKIIAENALLKSMVENPDSATREVGSLRRQVTQLKVKIVEMETFLGDYGLVWVGNNKPNIADDTCADVEPEPEDAMRHTVNFADFNMQIDELNAVIYSEPAQIVKEGANNRKARLVQSSELLETVRIVFYQNGLMIKRGPFRYCSAPNYKTFVQDIMDGYFPAEFQGEYPDGVVFDLKDQRTVMYVEGKTDPNFDQPQMSRAQFLNRLPKTVIHKGQVMGVRGEIADMLGGAGAGAGSEAAVTSKPKVVIENHSANTANVHSPDLGDTVKIQVKWVDQSAFIVNMCELHTVGQLRDSIVQHFQGTGTAIEFAFELRSAFPPRVLELNLSLKEAGLAPNGTVHARKLE